MFKSSDMVSFKEKAFVFFTEVLATILLLLPVGCAIIVLKWWFFVYMVGWIVMALIIESAKKVYDKYKRKIK
jgi:hypothetical protein